MQLSKVPKSLDWSDNKPIKFIDGFDRRITLPYEWCTTWQVLAHSSKAGRYDAYDMSCIIFNAAPF